MDLGSCDDSSITSPSSVSNSTNAAAITGTVFEDSNTIHTNNFDPEHYSQPIIPQHLLFPDDTDLTFPPDPLDLQPLLSYQAFSRSSFTTDPFISLDEADEDPDWSGESRTDLS